MLPHTHARTHARTRACTHTHTHNMRPPMTTPAAETEPSDRTVSSTAAQNATREPHVTHQQHAMVVHVLHIVEM